jgi:hypothetical protein
MQEKSMNLWVCATDVARAGGAGGPLPVFTGLLRAYTNEARLQIWRSVGVRRTHAKA